MIHTSKQLKDKVRNISKGDNEVAKALIRIFMMERFLERVSLSKYKNNFILKGGMLVASIVGVDMRATMDIDTTVKELPLNEQDFRKLIEKICAIQIEANLDRLRQPFKIDISTDDVITPDAIAFKYKLMFEDRTI